LKPILPVMLFLLVPATPAFGQCSDADQKVLETFDREWTAANARGDRAYLEHIYADDYMRTSLSGPRNKAEIIEATLKAAARDKANPQDAAKVSSDHFIITCTQNTATITHRSVVTTMSAGREQTAYLRGVHFLEKRGGRWQVVSITNHPLEDSMQLLFMESEWTEANRSRDVAWFEHNFADDFTFVSPRTGALQPKAEWIASLQNSKTSLDSVESSDLKVRVEGNMGIVTGVVLVKGRTERGQPIDDSLRFTSTYTKRDGRWLVLAAQATRIQ
jgi:ketosteroid isomerase-like protein